MPRNYNQANCFGYALRKNKWLHVWCFLDVLNGEVGEEKIIYELQNRYGLKPVKKEDMVLGKEYVAFRWSDEDYHFARRSKSGQWSHKQGSWTPEAMSTKEVFDEVWVNGYIHYTSDIFLFEA